MDRVYSLGEVAKLIGVAPHRIVYRHTSGKSPEPNRIFGNRAYCWPDVVAPARQFNLEVGGDKAAEMGNGL